ncbi:MAG: response regulator [Chrysiogenetes bacterium]|nr:response regulator [Chrysiogenetes bacterium]
MKTILLAEDSPTTRSLVVSTLEQLGDLEVVEASSGFEALKTLPRHKFDIIITDINMPDINGFELLNFVKHNQVYQHIPLIIITSEVSERDREKGKSLGADAYLAKPVDPEELQSVVRQYLGRH